MLPPSPPLPLPVSESTTVPVVRAPPPPAQSVPPPIPPVKSIDIRASDPRKRLTRMNAQRQRKGVKFSLENNSTGSPTIGTAISTTSTTTATATTTATTTTTPLLSEAEKIEILQALASPTPTNLDVFVEGYHRRSLNTTFLEAPDQIEDLQEEESGEEDNEVENAGEEDREIKKETDQLTPAIQTKSIMGSHCITLNYSKKEKHRQRQPHSRVMVVMSYQQFLQKQTSYLKRFQRLRKNKLRVDKQLNEL
jgi:hypothetical protein